MPRLNGGGGGKRFFPPAKDIGTREGDRLDKGKYFPLQSNYLSREQKKIFENYICCCCILRLGNEWTNSS